MQDDITSVGRVHKSSGTDDSVSLAPGSELFPEPSKNDGDPESTEAPGPSTTEPSSALGSSSNNDEPRNTTPSFKIVSCDGAFGFVGTYEPDNEPRNGNTVYVQVKTTGLQHCVYRDDDKWVFRDVIYSEPDGKRFIGTARVSTKPDAYHEAGEVPSRIEDCGGWIDCACGKAVTIDFAAITPSVATPEAASALAAVST